MSFEHFSAKWFTLYFVVLGCFLVGFGLYLILKKQKAATFLLEATSQENPPRLLLQILKYFLLFTLPGLVLAFFPFSWIELLFTLWSLLLVYLAGIQLVRWKQRRSIIKASADSLPHSIRRSGAIMVAVGLAIFLLASFVIKRAAF